MVERTATRRKAVNAEEKMHQRAGVKLHHGWMANAPTGGLLLRDNRMRRLRIFGQRDKLTADRSKGA